MRNITFFISLFASAEMLEKIWLDMKSFGWTDEVDILKRRRSVYEYPRCLGLTNVRQHLHRRTNNPRQPRALTYLARVMSC